MKRWKWIAICLGALLATACIVFGIATLLEKQAAGRRELTYEATLRSYQTTFAPGMRRSVVESELHKAGAQFGQLWGYNQSWADRILIGKEHAPWYCSEENVYVVLEFNERHNSHDAADQEDILQSTTLMQQDERCL